MNNDKFTKIINRELNIINEEVEDEVNSDDIYETVEELGKKYTKDLEKIYQ